MALNLQKEDLAEMYKKMLEIRCFEEKVFELYGQNLVPGTIHLYAGEEGVAVGVYSSLRRDDFMTSTHRGHGHCIAKGADLKRTMAEILGKKTGYCKGKGGSMHIADFSVGMLGATAVVGARVEKARQAKLTKDDLSGGTFTITNLGMYEVDFFTSIINPPEAAIPAIGKITQKPVIINSKIEIRPTLMLSLSYDHRIIDGAPAAQFLQRIKQKIEDPTSQ